MADEALREGIRMYKTKNYASSLTFFLSLPEDTKADPIDVAYYIGLNYTKLKRYDDALIYLEQVVTAGVNKASSEERILQCRYILAVIYCLSGRKKLSDFELNKLLETGYMTSAVYSSLAYIAFDNDEAEAAIELYEKALQEDEKNSTALNGLGYVLATQGKELTKALSLCKKALDIQPESAACLDSLGYVYFKMGLYSEAKKYLERALKQLPENNIILAHLDEVERSQE